MTTFWDMASCSPTLMMGAVHTSETSVYFFWTARCCISEDCHLHTRCRENLKFRLLTLLFDSLNIFLQFRIVLWDVLPCKIIVDRRRSTVILHGSTSHKTVLNFILAAVRALNLIFFFSVRRILRQHLKLETSEFL
jgi:hypothetical protein